MTPKRMAALLGTLLVAVAALAGCATPEETQEPTTGDGMQDGTDNGMGGNQTGMDGNQTGMDGNQTGMDGNQTGMDGNETGMGGDMMSPTPM